MRRHPLPLLGLALFAVSALFATACGSADDDGHAMTNMPHGAANAAPAGAITVTLRNWAVVPDGASAKAGQVTFWAVHDMSHMHAAGEGGVTHDLQVMRKLPGGGLELVGQVTGLRMGEAKALTIELVPGDYELACNVVEEIGGKAVSHYIEGMHTPFKVTPG
jgi:hypothetical protein